MSVNNSGVPSSVNINVLNNIKPDMIQGKSASEASSSKLAELNLTEEELQLLDIDGNGEVTSEELDSIIQEHDVEMVRISNEYDDAHTEEASYAWKNQGSWSDEKNEYMNAKDVLYRDEHPEYVKATDIKDEITRSDDNSNGDSIIVDGTNNNPDKTVKENKTKLA